MNALRLQVIESSSRVVETPEDVIVTEGLFLAFGTKHALSNLTLHVPRGRIHAIVGANGAGKSSLFRVLLGLQAPTGGTAKILGEDVTRLSPHTRARIGYVNDEHAIPPWLRVADAVDIQRSHYSRWDEARYREIAGHFHFGETQRIGELSRGERAGVNLAITLAQRPELLLLDEPTLGLDIVAKRAFLEQLLAAADDDCTILYCSHQIEEIERLADNLIVLERGTLVHQSMPDAFCRRVALWIAEFAFVPPELSMLPKVLQMRRIDGLHHLLVLDPDEDFADRLVSLGARRLHNAPVSLDHAVNAFLSRNHAVPEVRQ
jgi:ABC-2 type transport system ATP-binding protein